MDEQMSAKITFSFGKNWTEFLKRFNEGLLPEAKDSLTEFLGLKDLHDKTFVDIGCGSGLFSLAAFQLGAKRVVSFDADEYSVKCCQSLWEQAGRPDNWKVMSGSVLDDRFLSELGTFDIVYSWGVLHHTGRMWDAIEKAARLTNPDGYYYITIYNRVGGLFGSRYWLHVKKLYNSYPFIGRYFIEPLHVAGKFMVKILRLQNPLAIIRNYKVRQRGMSWRRDITDWLGGYPYEYASVDEIFTFMKKHFSQYRLVNIKSSAYKRPNWFLYKRES